MRQALNHSLGRNGRVVQVLCYLSLMKNHGRLWSSRPSVTVSAAKFQNYSASRGQQAAHYLPGQLKIDGQPLSHYASDPGTKRTLDCLFGDVESLPANFNKADSEAEAKGLCRAFAASAEAVMTAAAAPSSDALGRATVRQVYAALWVPRARQAFMAALSAKAAKFSQPDLVFGAAGGVEYDMISNLDEREAASQYQRDVTEQRHILEQYILGLNIAPRELSDRAMAELERGFKP